MADEKKKRGWLTNVAVFPFVALNTFIDIGVMLVTPREHRKTTSKLSPWITGGVVAVAGASGWAMMSNNAAQARLQYEEQTAMDNKYPFLSVATGMSSSENEHTFYYTSTSLNSTVSEQWAMKACQEEEANCKIEVTSYPSVPDCFKMTVLSHSYHEFPKLDLTRLYNHEGERNDTDLGLNCTRPTQIEGNFASCSPSQTYFCNNPDLLKEITDQMLTAPRVAP